MLRARINDDLKHALKSKDQVALSTLRLMLAATKDRDIAARSEGNCDGIDDAEIISLLQKMIRQRRDSIDTYEKAGRRELVEREAAEIEVIKRFLPQEMAAEEVESAVAAAISETAAANLKDMGKVMGALKAQYAGRMDFGKANQIVKQRLA